MQIFLIVCGLAVAVGGIFMVYKASRDRRSRARGPYVPLAMTFIGIMIAYRSFHDFASLNSMDYVIMFLFVFALMTILGIQFFIVDKSNPDE